MLLCVRRQELDGEAGAGSGRRRQLKQQVLCALRARGGAGGWRQEDVMSRSDCDGRVRWRREGNGRILAKDGRGVEDLVQCLNGEACRGCGRVAEGVRLLGREEGGSGAASVRGDGALVGVEGLPFHILVRV